MTAGSYSSTFGPYGSKLSEVNETMTQGVPSPVVGKKILDLAEAEERPLTPLQVLKLVFLAHGWGYVGLGSDRSLISDPVEAWQFGPVHKKLYHMIKKYGSDPVTEISLKEYENDDSVRINLENDEKELIEIVYNKYKKLSGSQLITLTHEKGSPWDQSKHKIPYYWNREIDSEIISEYYHDEYNKMKSE